MKAARAHLLSVFLASGVLMISLGALDAGPAGMLFRWVGGFLIFGSLAVATVPLGLAVRWIAKRALVPDMRGAVFVGVLVSLGLVPVLHPAMMPSVAMATQPVGLLVSHTLAGAVGGLVWWSLEHPIREDVS